MLILAWIIVGMSLALVWHWLIGPREDRYAPHQLLLAITGAIVGGILFMLFGTNTWETVNSYSMVVSTAGALVFLAAYRSIKSVY